MSRIGKLPVKIPGGVTVTVADHTVSVKSGSSELTRRLNAEINRIMALPDVKAKMEAIGVEPVNETPEQFAATLRADAQKWGRLVKELNIKSE